MTLTHDDKYLAVVVGEKELRLYDSSNFELVSTLQVSEPCSGYREILFAPLLMGNSGYMLVTVTGRMGVYDFNPQVKVPVLSVVVPLDDTESEGDEGSLDECHKRPDVRTTSVKSTMTCITERQFHVLGWNVGFSPDGTFMVYTTLRAKERKVCIWDVKQRRTRKIVNPELKRPNVTICPNSKLIATGGLHGPLRIWKAANGDCVSVFEVAEKDKVLNVIFSPDSKWLAVHHRKGERLHRIYDIATGQTIFSISNSYSPRAWSIGGNLLAASSVTGHREIVLVDGITGAERVRWDLGDEEGD
jgi:WD40 repeat protein